MRGLIILKGRKKRALLLLCIPLLVTACSLKKQTPVAAEGTIDLSGWDFERDGAVDLKGTWLLVRNRLLLPNDSFNAGDFFDSEKGEGEGIAVPGKWNNRLEIFSGRCPGDGVGTYLLRIKNIDLSSLSEPSLLMRNISSAYRLYILPSQKIKVKEPMKPHAEGGAIGLSREETRPGRIQSLVLFDAPSRETVLLLQVANFHHYYGGIFKNISLGNRSSLDRRIHYKVAIVYFTLGVFIIMGLYYGQFFLQRRREYSSCIIALLCLVFAVRLLVSSGFLYELNYNSSPFLFEIFLKVDIITFFAGVPLFYRYFWLLFPEEFSICLRNSIWIFAICVLVPVLLLPFRKSFMIVELFFMLSLILVGYFFIAMIQAIRHGRPLAWQSLAGLIFLISAVIPDFLSLQNLVMVPSFITYGTASYGLLGFIFIQNSIFSKRFTEAQRKAEELNVSLEQRVQERTADLETVIQYMADANVMLSDLSIMDGLTGLKNRSFFNERIQKDWNNALRVKTNLSLLMLDIDHFKNINDTRGHQAGDECLKQIARIIRNNIHRPTDSVSRYGGEEFAVTLNGTDSSGARHVAEWIRKEIESTVFVVEEKEITMTISIGVASMVPEEKDTSALLVAEADKALYRAKAQGRNRVITAD